MQTITVMRTSSQQWGFHQKKETLLWGIKYRRKSQKASDIIKMSHPTSNLYRPQGQHHRCPLFQNERKHTKEPSSQSQALQQASGLWKKKKSQANI